MKPSSLLSKAVAAAATAPSLAHALPSPSPTTTAPPSGSATPRHEPLPLATPLNWYAGRTLFPGQILAGFGAPYADHTMETWAEHVLSQCKANDECNSTISFAAVDEKTGKTCWHGYIFWGKHTTRDDYSRSSRVHGSVAYNVLRQPKA
ncbi:hypothetical protein HRG_010802 [Hirsutella rhossiliensis]|uniref:Uncharacterized protein n=1 Tax=Hirsutella rhossiliensis TaxID=111463 RepID=A0A9P8MRW9_9HYPO|nr:uncharacterized protein HRG_10802 [Hirsutella rhossiliensis]KAH0958107.1 hypothetical protein HRG_10802 [Hirsutella rhossiliensis]